MKKPFLIFSLFIILVSVLVYSCSTKNDPAVPDHTTNINTVSNTVTFQVQVYTLAVRDCYIDTSSGKHYVMSGTDVGQKFSINILFGDSTAPSAFPVNYLVMPPTVSSLNSGECIISLTAANVIASPWVATSGTISLSSIQGNIAVNIKSVPVVNTSDSSKTSFITGDWKCQ